jgi:hypothetical protein
MQKPPVGAAAFSAQDFLIALAEGKPPMSLPAATPARKRRIWAERVR